MSNAFATPYYPKATLKRKPLPTKTKSAPKAKHLKISEPFLMPPSMKTYILDPISILKDVYFKWRCEWEGEPR
jgi:hypothetical protein